MTILNSKIFLFLLFFFNQYNFIFSDNLLPQQLEDDNFFKVLTKQNFDEFKKKQSKTKNKSTQQDFTNSYLYIDKTVITDIEIFYGFNCNFKDSDLTQLTKLKNINLFILLNILKKINSSLGANLHFKNLSVKLIEFSKNYNQTKTSIGITGGLPVVYLNKYTKNETIVLKDINISKDNQIHHRIGLTNITTYTFPKPYLNVLNYISVWFNGFHMNGKIVGSIKLLFSFFNSLFLFINIGYRNDDIKLCFINIGFYFLNFGKFEITFILPLNLLKEIMYGNVKNILKINGLYNFNFNIINPSYKFINRSILNQDIDMINDLIFLDYDSPITNIKKCLFSQYDHLTPNEKNNIFNIINHEIFIEEERLLSFKKIIAFDKDNQEPLKKFINIVFTTDAINSQEFLNEMDGIKNQVNHKRNQLIDNIKKINGMDENQLNKNHFIKIYQEINNIKINVQEIINKMQIKYGKLSFFNDLFNGLTETWYISIVNDDRFLKFKSKYNEFIHNRKEDNMLSLNFDIPERIIGALAENNFNTETNNIVNSNYFLFEKKYPAKDLLKINEILKEKWKLLNIAKIQQDSLDLYKKTIADEADKLEEIFDVAEINASTFSKDNSAIQNIYNDFKESYNNIKSYDFQEKNKQINGFLKNLDETDIDFERNEILKDYFISLPKFQEQLTNLDIITQDMISEKNKELNKIDVYFSSNNISFSLGGLKIRNLITFLSSLHEELEKNMPTFNFVNFFQQKLINQIDPEFNKKLDENLDDYINSGYLVHNKKIKIIYKFFYIINSFYEKVFFQELNMLFDKISNNIYKKNLKQQIPLNPIGPSIDQTESQLKIKQLINNRKRHIFDEQYDQLLQDGHEYINIFMTIMKDFLLKEYNIELPLILSSLLQQYCIDLKSNASDSLDLLKTIIMDSIIFNDEEQKKKFQDSFDKLLNPEPKEMKQELISIIKGLLKFNFFSKADSHPLKEFFITFIKKKFDVFSDIIIDEEFLSQFVNYIQKKHNEYDKKITEDLNEIISDKSVSNDFDLKQIQLPPLNEKQNQQKILIFNLINLYINFKNSTIDEIETIITNNQSGSNPLAPNLNSSKNPSKNFILSHCENTVDLLKIIYNIIELKNDFEYYELFHKQNQALENQALKEKTAKEKNEIKTIEFNSEQKFFDEKLKNFYIYIFHDSHIPELDNFNKLQNIQEKLNSELNLLQQKLQDKLAELKHKQLNKNSAQKLKYNAFDYINLLKYINDKNSKNLEFFQQNLKQYIQKSKNELVDHNGILECFFSENDISKTDFDKYKECNTLFKTKWTTEQKNNMPNIQIKNFLQEHTVESNDNLSNIIDQINNGNLTLIKLNPQQQQDIIYCNLNDINTTKTTLENEIETEQLKLIEQQKNLTTDENNINKFNELVQILKNYYNGLFFNMNFVWTLDDFKRDHREKFPDFENNIVIKDLFDFLNTKQNNSQWISFYINEYLNESTFEKLKNIFDQIPDLQPVQKLNWFQSFLNKFSKKKQNIDIYEKARPIKALFKSLSGEQMTLMKDGSQQNGKINDCFLQKNDLLLTDLKTEIEKKQKIYSDLLYKIQEEKKQKIKDIFSKNEEIIKLQSQNLFNDFQTFIINIIQEINLEKEENEGSDFLNMIIKLGKDFLLNPDLSYPIEGPIQSFHVHDENDTVTNPDFKDLTTNQLLIMLSNIFNHETNKPIENFIENYKNISKNPQFKLKKTLSIPNETTNNIYFDSIFNKKTLIFFQRKFNLFSAIEKHRGNFFITLQDDDSDKNNSNNTINSHDSQVEKISKQKQDFFWINPLSLFSGNFFFTKSKDSSNFIERTSINNINIILDEIGKIGYLEFYTNDVSLPVEILSHKFYKRNSENYWTIEFNKEETAINSSLFKKNNNFCKAKYYTKKIYELEKFSFFYFLAPMNMNNFINQSQKILTNIQNFIKDHEDEIVINFYQQNISKDNILTIIDNINKDINSDDKDENIIYSKLFNFFYNFSIKSLNIYNGNLKAIEEGDGAKIKFSLNGDFNHLSLILSDSKFIESDSRIEKIYNFLKKFSELEDIFEFLLSIQKNTESLGGGNLINIMQKIMANNLPDDIKNLLNFLTKYKTNISNFLSFYKLIKNTIKDLLENKDKDNFYLIDLIARFRVLVQKIKFVNKLYNNYYNLESFENIINDLESLLPDDNKDENISKILLKSFEYSQSDMNYKIKQELFLDTGLNFNQGYVIELIERLYTQWNINKELNKFLFPNEILDNESINCMNNLFENVIIKLRNNFVNIKDVEQIICSYKLYQSTIFNIYYYTLYKHKKNQDKIYQDKIYMFLKNQLIVPSNHFSLLKEDVKLLLEKEKQKQPDQKDESIMQNLSHLGLTMEIPLDSFLKQQNQLEIGYSLFENFNQNFSLIFNDLYQDDLEKYKEKGIILNTWQDFFYKQYKDMSNVSFVDFLQPLDLFLDENKNLNSNLKSMIKKNIDDIINDKESNFNFWDQITKFLKKQLDPNQFFINGIITNYLLKNTILLYNYKTYKTYYGDNHFIISDEAKDNYQQQLILKDILKTIVLLKKPNLYGDTTCINEIEFTILLNNTLNNQSVISSKTIYIPTNGYEYKTSGIERLIKSPYILTNKNQLFYQGSIDEINWSKIVSVSSTNIKQENKFSLINNVLDFNLKNKQNIESNDLEKLHSDYNIKIPAKSLFTKNLLTIDANNVSEDKYDNLIEKFFTINMKLLEINRSLLRYDISNIKNELLSLNESTTSNFSYLLSLINIGVNELAPSYLLRKISDPLLNNSMFIWNENTLNLVLLMYKISDNFLTQVKEIQSNPSQENMVLFQTICNHFNFINHNEYIKFFQNIKELLDKRLNSFLNSLSSEKQNSLLSSINEVIKKK